jgi:hypothetical protein
MVMNALSFTQGWEITDIIFSHRVAEVVKIQQNINVVPQIAKLRTRYIICYSVKP